MYRKYPEQINLNYLRIFNELYITRSTTLAAAKLGITQSAVSQVLSKLRLATDDPLFIKGQNHLVPTVRATTIGEGLANELIQLDKRFYPQDFLSHGDFDGEINFAIGSPLIDVIAKNLVEIVIEVLPKAKINFTHWGDHTLDQVINGDVHIGLNLFPINAPKEIRQIPLIESQPIFISRTPNAWIEEGMELSGFEKHDFAGIIFSDINRMQPALENNDLTEGFKFKFRSESHSILAQFLQSDNSIVIADKLSALYYPGHYFYEVPDKVANLLPSRLSYALYYLQANQQHQIYSGSKDLVKSLIAGLLSSVELIANRNLHSDSTIT
ncbi:LysR family transcriptional regulator [Shewanella sp. MMG014]|uniref:LysR family transcriptional regulator n=1 Tax=Shewanella sp. MMG014 TaxID=2822691 RepID=UPI001B393906|nr:LysR family transcriptional regulator [Shewanella sp. MMG014]MBQ4889214.1 LysR family transcriptional regulator [Shewanella sp. MMG014]